MGVEHDNSRIHNSADNFPYIRQTVIIVLMTEGEAVLWGLPVAVMQ